eukprot:CAMPEP_0183403186 /NCGR_PEP_ID=MMETSP0370-20130417/14411_1 /TAXON_ID=268820 /ORGANISM="Peridinium aciculiferum, Strain PAER-2" /LENGTH=73 /DNA_ID=CAMNT_0025584897 /DNA_START=54 /DNA_END=272 /DNA_ORIENTATION=+
MGRGWKTRLAIAACRHEPYMITTPLRHFAHQSLCNATSRPSKATSDRMISSLVVLALLPVGLALLIRSGVLVL